MSTELYQQLIERVTADVVVQRVMLGLNWTSVQAHDIGLCFSPQDVPRTLDWPGTLVGRSARELAAWLLHWHPAEACVGLATINACVNHDNRLLRDAQTLHNPAPGHLRVFEHFRRQLAGKSVVVIGRYPGLEQCWPDIHFHCIERRPQGNDLPDMAAEWLLPEADWVFITASSIANKTVHRLLTLATDATVVLLGPSLPWLELWGNYGVDYLAGVRVGDANALWQVVAEGGGTRLFAGAVEYALLDLM
jgi:hypothetical protein